MDLDNLYDQYIESGADKTQEFEDYLADYADYVESTQADDWRNE